MAIKFVFNALAGGLDIVENSLKTVGAVISEPTGFATGTYGYPTTDATITLTGSTTREFKIEPSGSSYDVYVQGTKYTKSGAETVNWPDTDGLHIFYFDSSGTLITSSSLDIVTQAIIWIVYWNATYNEIVYSGNELHSYIMDGSTHSWLHYHQGCMWNSGGALSDINSEASGNLNSSATCSVSSTYITDEDVRHQAVDGSPQDLYPIAQIPVLYLDGSVWRKETATDYPVKRYGASRLAWNNSGAQTEVGNNDFVLSHIYATNDVINPIVAIQGQAVYGNRRLAREGATTEINNLVLGGLPAAEIVPLGTIIFQTSDSYSNAVKARIRKTDEGFDYQDFRQFKAASASGSVSDHGNLSGLNDDDHEFYLPIDGSKPMTGDLDMDDNNIQNVDYIEFDLTSVTVGAEGRLKWNSDDGTLEYGLPGGNVNLQIGQEMVVRARNTTGVTIANGAAVYVSGASGSRPTVALADADVLAATHTIGIATEEILNNQNGFITTEGLVRDINTSSFSAGDVLYVSTTAGGITNSAPTGDSTIIEVGHCLFSNAGSGIIFVHVERIPHVNELSAVNITTPTDGQTLIYDSATSTWVNGDPGMKALKLKDTSNTVTHNSWTTLNLTDSSDWAVDNSKLSSIRVVTNCDNFTAVLLFKDEAIASKVGPGTGWEPSILIVNEYQNGNIEIPFDGDGLLYEDEDASKEVHIAIYNDHSSSVSRNFDFYIRGVKVT